MKRTKAHLTRIHITSRTNRVWFGQAFYPPAAAATAYAVRRCPLVLSNINHGGAGELHPWTARRAIDLLSFDKSEWGILAFSQSQRSFGPICYGALLVSHVDTFRSSAVLSRCPYSYVDVYWSSGMVWFNFVISVDLFNPNTMKWMWVTSFLTDWFNCDALK
jgi:hypothetical protein